MSLLACLAATSVTLPKGSIVMVWAPGKGQEDTQLVIPKLPLCSGVLNQETCFAVTSLLGGD